MALELSVRREMSRMLIVDDEPDVCECLRDFFSAKGFAVTEAFTGHGAIERFVEDHPDVVLLDLKLPDCFGLEVLHHLKALAPEVRVVMVTSLDRPELRHEAAEGGACGYVTKPFDFADSTWAPVFA